ncbi:hypothetical protein GCM10023200_36760 [Actinomycetospora chlora]|uniref:DUF1206 domain-containing protein n=1 Tax=Actinomycetospora chlora TaxID=663608 RepID=A0ABP9BPQ3_9PSEU
MPEPTLPRPRLPRRRVVTRLPAAPAAPARPVTPTPVPEPVTSPPAAAEPAPATAPVARRLWAWATRRGGGAGALGVEVLGRAGLVAYGVLHLLLAGLAARLLWGARGVRADQDAAIAVVAGIGPAGAALLGVAVVCLVAFAVWQIRAACWGFRWTGGGERFRKRVGAAAKAIAMLSVATLAFPPAVGPLRTPPPGPPPAPPQNGTRTLVTTMLGLPEGRLLVAAVSLVALVMAAAMVYTGVRATFLGDLHHGHLTPAWRRVAVACGSYGNLARAVLVGAVGLFFGAAAVTDDARRSGGLTQALRLIDHGPVGVVGIVLIAGGTAAYGVYCFIDAYARRA